MANYHHQIPYSMSHHHMLHNSISNTSFINQEEAAFYFGELEEAIVHQRGVNVNIKSHHDETKQHLYHTAAAAAETLEMFPSLPMRFQYTSMTGEGSSDSRLEAESPISQKSFSNKQNSVEQDHQRGLQPQPQQEMEMASGSGGVSKAQQAKQNPQKTLRRLAQNREAAKKSRLRKKAYVQQLESSRIRLAQLEQELNRARSQGLFLGASGVSNGNISSGGAMFDMEYARWLDDNHRHMTELRTALQAHLPDGDLRLIVEGYMAHYDEIFQLKSVVAKSDVFHLITGTWTSPAERCFLWMGGFRPSDLIKILISQLDPLTEQQVVGIYSLQHSSQQAEEALSQGLEQLQQSLIDTIANASSNDSMQHMANALGKLASLEGFVRQADNLRQQTLHQLRRLLTVRQAARCFLVIGEYYGRLRALSTLWASRPRESLIADGSSCQTTSDMRMVQSSQNQFPNF